MKSEEKIARVLARIKDKIDISPSGVEIEYRAGEERSGVGTEDEILILNKLEAQGVIEVISNYSSEYI